MSHETEPTWHTPNPFGVHEARNCVGVVLFPGDRVEVLNDNTWPFQKGEIQTVFQDDVYIVLLLAGAYGINRRNIRKV